MSKLNYKDFKERLIAATKRAIKIADKYIKEIPYHDGYLYYSKKMDKKYDYNIYTQTIKVPFKSIITLEDVIENTFRISTGEFRTWINISTDGIMGKKLVFDLDWSEVWSSTLKSDLLMPIPPFQVTGPSIEEQNIAILKEYSYVDENFEWLLGKNDIQGLGLKDSQERLKTIQNIYRKVFSGFSDEMVASEIDNFARSEREADIIILYLYYISFSKNSVYSTIVKQWTKCKEAKICKAAYLTLGIWPNDNNFKYMIEAIINEKTGLKDFIISAALNSINGKRKRFEELISKIDKKQISKKNIRILNRIEKEVSS